MKILLFVAATIILSAQHVLSQPGTHDISFDHNGIVKTNFGNNSVDVANDIFVLPDGKILAAGPLSPGTNTIQTGIARYLSNGIPDSSFDGDGQVIVEIATDLYQSKVLAVASGGKMFVGGYILQAFKYYPAVISLFADGSVDTTYGENGYYADTTTEGQITSIVLQPDGKLIVAGYFGTSGNHKLLTRRLLINGVKDSSFDDQIENTEAYGELRAFAALQPDGKIIVGGSKWSANADFALRRFNNDGSVDAAFGTVGLVQTNINGSDYMRDVIVQSDGKILASGFSIQGSQKAIIARYNTNGSLDNSFDGDGIKIISESQVALDFEAMAVQGDGKIVAVGYFFSYTNYAAVFRFNVDGSNDGGFGSDGRVIDSIGETSALNAVTIQADGKILVTGETRSNKYYNFLLVRYNNAEEICGIPSGLSTSNITSTSSILNWIPVGSPDKFKIRYQAPMADVKIITVPDGNATSYMLSDLEPSTSYTWRIQEICNGSHSAYSTKQTFQTAPLKISAQSTDGIDVSIFPNPATDEATIEFTLAKSGETNVELLDLSGRKIKIIAKRNFEAGNHEASFSFEDIPAGIYFVRFETSGQINFVKMMKQ